jgi:hypothetical protein
MMVLVVMLVVVLMLTTLMLVLMLVLVVMLMLTTLMLMNFCHNLFPFLFSRHKDMPKKLQPSCKYGKKQILCNWVAKKSYRHPCRFLLFYYLCSHLSE